MQKIAFYSYKGGVGRSLTLANLASYLAGFGARVLMIDFDLEAPGLHYKFGLTSQSIGENRGITGFLADASSGRELPRVQDLVLSIQRDQDGSRTASSHMPGTSVGNLWLVPAGNPLSHTYWTDLASIDWSLLFASRRTPGATALATLIDNLSLDLQPDFLLIDSRTGITPSGGVATSLFAEVVVMMLLGTPEHLEGSHVIAASLNESRDIEGRQPSLVPVISRFQSEEVRGASSLISDEIRASNRSGLSAVVARVEDALRAGDSSLNKMSRPFVLHSDASLLQRERLAFSEFDSRRTPLADSGLLDDYLRLFSHIVPADLMAQYVEPVRQRARAMMMDSPGESVRTLEELSRLAPTRDVLTDLLKMYVVRRETNKLVEAASSLWVRFREIAKQPEILEALQLLFRQRSSRRTRQDPAVDSTFVYQYWLHQARQDLAFGLQAANYLLSGPNFNVGRQILDEIFGEDLAGAASDDLVEAAISLLANGNPRQEREAVRLAKRLISADSNEQTLVAAARAAEYVHDEELARLIVAQPAFADAAADVRARTFLLGGLASEAKDIALSALLLLEEDEAGSDLGERLFKLISRDGSAIAELQATRPALHESLRLRAQGSQRRTF